MITLQGVGPVALVSLLLSDQLTAIIPGSEIITDPNRPEDPGIQDEYNRAAIQVCALLSLLSCDVLNYRHYRVCVCCVYAWFDVRDKYNLAAMQVLVTTVQYHLESCLQRLNIVR
jgi:hypothetical protein